MSHVDLERMKVVEAAMFEGASSGLLSKEDLEEASKALGPGSAAGVLVYENVWAAPFAAALHRSGGQLVAYGRIPVQALIATLDDLEATSWPNGTPQRS